MIFNIEILYFYDVDSLRLITSNESRPSESVSTSQIGTINTEFIMDSEIPTKQTLNHLFNYSDGNLYWKRRASYNVPAGSIAGYQNRPRYITVVINKKIYLLPRIIWVYHYDEIPPNLVIDHINNNTKDNRIVNLRLLTFQENQFNRLNAKGYSWVKKDKMWHARIKVDGKLLSLGYHENESRAKMAYLSAKSRYHIIIKKEV